MSKLDFILSDKPYNKEVTPSTESIFTGMDLGKNLYGIRILESTHIPEGSALVMNNNELVWSSQDVYNFSDMLESMNNNVDEVLITHRSAWEDYYE